MKVKPSPPGRADSEKIPERKVKSVNFTDLDLLEFATKRADNIYGGNFSAYVMTLIERDRSLGDERRRAFDLEGAVMEIIRSFGGVQAQHAEPYDFVIPSLNLVIETKSRFPRERQLEYRTLSTLQKIAVTAPGKKIALVIPADLPPQEKERFRQFETAGIENLRVCDVAELKTYLGLLASPEAAGLDAALKEQDDATPRLKRRRLLEM